MWKKRENNEQVGEKREKHCRAKEAVSSSENRWMQILVCPLIATYFTPHPHLPSASHLTK